MQEGIEAMSSDGVFGYHDLERAALGFALEDESWPAFLEWMRARHISSECHTWLATGPNLLDLRRDYMRHSPYASVREAADRTRWAGE